MLRAHVGEHSRQPWGSSSSTKEKLAACLVYFSYKYGQSAFVVRAAPGCAGRPRAGRCALGLPGVPAQSGSWRAGAGAVPQAVTQARLGPDPPRGTRPALPDTRGGHRPVSQPSLAPAHLSLPSWPLTCAGRPPSQSVCPLGAWLWRVSTSHFIKSPFLSLSLDYGFFGLKLLSYFISFTLCPVQLRRIPRSA